MNQAFLGLGSNLGDRAAFLSEALRRLDAFPGVRICAVSALYETDPVGVTEQPSFLNGVASVETDLAPADLLHACLDVEQSLGRERRERWGPRTIDLDLLWYDGQSISTDHLSLPHPRMLERAFVLVPLAELAPNLILAGETAAARASRFGLAGVRKVRALPWPPG